MPLSNVELGFILVTAAGLSTALGAGLVFFKHFVHLANKTFLAAALATSAGVMLYVSLVEIFQKSVAAFENYGVEGGLASAFATSSFFGGIVFILLVERLVHWIDHAAAEATHHGTDDASEDRLEKDITAAEHQDAAREAGALDGGETPAMGSLVSAATAATLQSSDGDIEGLELATGLRAVASPRSLTRGEGSAESHVSAHGLVGHDGLAHPIATATVAVAATEAAATTSSSSSSSSSSVFASHVSNAAVLDPAGRSFDASGAVSTADVAVELRRRETSSAAAAAAASDSASADVGANVAAGATSSATHPSTTILVESKLTDESLAPPVDEKRLVKMGLMTAVAIGIHNFPEGLATFVATLGDPRIGGALAVAIGIHNIPEGLCVSIPVFYATGSRWKAFLWALLSGVSEPIGALLGWLILKDILSELVYGVLFGLVAGIMVYICVHELIPTAHRYDPEDRVSTKGVLGGMAVMALSLVLFAL